MVFKKGLPDSNVKRNILTMNGPYWSFWDNSECLWSVCGRFGIFEWWFWSSFWSFCDNLGLFVVVLRYLLWSGSVSRILFVILRFSVVILHLFEVILSLIVVILHFFLCLLRALVVHMLVIFKTLFGNSSFFCDLVQSHTECLPNIFISLRY